MVGAKDIGFLLTTIVAVSCAQPVAKNSAVPNLSRTAPIATIKHWGGGILSPSYEIVIYADGTVLYDGRAGVKVRGRQHRCLSREQLEQLHAAFRRADYFSLLDVYADVEHTDSPAVSTSYVHKGNKKRVVHFRADRSAPERLRVLEREIDAIVRSKEWTGY